MKIEIQAELDKRTLLSHFLLDCAEQFVGELTKDEYKENGCLDIELRVNGIDVNPQDFFNHLDKHIDNHEAKFEKWKKKYLSTNSVGAKETKIKSKLDAIYVELQNIRKELK